MDSSDLREFIAARAITAEIIHLADHTPTVEVAAQALGVPVLQVAKSILFLAGEAPVLVIANGPSRVDFKRLADQLGLPRKRVRMANAAEVLAIAGFVVGSMPPFGHKNPLRTLLDLRLFDQPEVYAGGGDLNAMLRIEPRELARVTGGRQVDVTQAPD